MHEAALHNRLTELAADLGRLRRRTEPDTSIAWSLERIASHAETLLLMLEPTAAELAATHAPGDDQAAAEAIRIVDTAHHARRRLLGWQDAT